MKRKKITLDAVQMKRLALLANGRDDSKMYERELDGLEEELSRKITSILEKNQGSMNKDDGDDQANDDKNIDANWNAIKNRLEALEKPSVTADKPVAVAEVHSLSQARTRQQTGMENESRRPKKSKFLPYSLVAFIAAAAAVVLYVMPGKQQETNLDGFSVKGTGAIGVAVCTFELRSNEHTHLLGDQPALVSGGEKFALIARCPEAQVLHVKISTQNEAPVVALNRSVTNSSGQIILPADGEGELLQFAGGSTYSIEFVSSSSVLADQDQIFTNPDIESNWRLSHVVTAE